MSCRASVILVLSATVLFAPGPIFADEAAPRISEGEYPSAAPGPLQPVIEAGLASHDRALFIKRGWIRDPHIVADPDDSRGNPIPVGKLGRSAPVTLRREEPEPKNKP